MHEAAGVVLAAAALVTAVGVILRSTPARWLGRRLVGGPINEALADHLEPLLEARLVPVTVKLELIHAQLTPNGGSAIPDRLSGIEERLRRLEDSQAGTDAVLHSVLKERHP